MICKAANLHIGQGCRNQAAKDGYCDSHWDFLFKGMTNRQRMIEKKHLDGIIKEKEPAKNEG